MKKIGIFLSAGHGMTDRGTTDPGAVSPFEGEYHLVEMDFTYGFTGKLENALHIKGVPIIRVPDTVLGLKGRARWIKDEASRRALDDWIAIQIHANSGPAGASGSEVIAGPTTENEVILFGLQLVTRTSSVLGLATRGVKIDERIGRRIFWVRAMRRSLIWEVGFLTDQGDVGKLKALLSNNEDVDRIADILKLLVEERYGI